MMPTYPSKQPSGLRRPAPSDRRPPSVTRLGLMRETVYHLLRKHLSQQSRRWLQARIAHMRRRLTLVYRGLYGSFGADELCAELAGHLPADVEIIMVHSSLNDLAPMFVGTVGELLDGLIELCGPTRTLAMPAFFFGGSDRDPYSYYRRRPMFDVRRHPSQMGILSEAFRRRVDVRRSLHPTASVCALGPLADDLVRDHHCAETTFGAGTPFGRMADHKTAIVGIGTEYFRCLSQVHAAEDILGDRYPLNVRPRRLPVQLMSEDGRVYDYELAVSDGGTERRMELLERLMAPPELTVWRFHGVLLFVTSARRVTEVLIDAALRGETIYEAMPIRQRALAG